jgi:hypothetical protein
MRAARWKAAEHYSLDRLERAIRVAWLTGAAKLMQGRYPTLGQFLLSALGKRFRRRCNWVLSR